MTELNASTLSQLPPKVAAPPYDRSRLKRGIAHFGVGNFRRAHQAFYIDGGPVCTLLLAQPFPQRHDLSSVI